MQIYAGCLDKGIPPQVTDEMDACQYIRIMAWQLSQLYPLKEKPIKTIEDWIF
jgi:hypothetical protein